MFCVCFVATGYSASGQEIPGSTERSESSVSIDPVVIVPGITTSWNWDVMRERNVVRDDWGFLIGVDHYDALIESLRKAGVDVTVAFYDWRRPIEEAAEVYLKATIGAVKARTGAARVDIVAHSMGGLVARSYIQSAGYGFDVDQLIMLGTPHQGSSDIYPVWAGGYIPTNWGIEQRLGLRMYLSYLRNQLEDATVLNAGSNETLSDADLIHGFVPGVKDLLPMFSYIMDALTGDVVPVSEYTRNDFLLNLNDPGRVRALVERVRVAVIRGDEQPTAHLIPVVQPSPEELAKGLWVDGKPEPIDPVREDSGGDNRVLLQSSHLPYEDALAIKYTPAIRTMWSKFVRTLLLPFQRFVHTAQAFFIGIPPAEPPPIVPPEEPTPLVHEETIVSPHAQLPNNGIDEVFAILDLGAPPLIREPHGIVQRALALWVDSPVRVFITDPQGRTINAANMSAIPGASYDAPTGISSAESTDIPQVFYVPDPIDGEYGIKLQGTDNGTYHVGLGVFSDEAHERVATTTGYIVQNQVIEYRAVVDSKSDGVISTQPHTLELRTSLEDIRQFLSLLIRSNGLSRQFATPLMQLIERAMQYGNKPQAIRVVSQYLKTAEQMIQTISRHGFMTASSRDAINSLIGEYRKTLQ